MSSSLLIVALVVVWLFVLAPMVIQNRKPIRRTGDGLALTRTLHAGGGRRLQPRRSRVLPVELEEAEEIELFGLPSGAGSTDAELVEADSWLDRLEEDRARHLAAMRKHRGRGSRPLATRPRRAGAEEQTAGAAADSRGDRGGRKEVLAATGTDGAGDSSSARERRGQAGRATAARRPRVEVSAAFSGNEDSPAVARSAEAAEQSSQRNRRPEAEDGAALGRAGGVEDETYVVDGEVFERPEEQPEPTAREQREAAQAARAAARAAEKPRAPELDAADYDFVERRRGRGVYDPRADRRAAVERAVRRQRTALGLLAVTVLFAVAAALLTPHLWWAAGLGAVLLVGYLAYLRKQVRMEQNLRARRMERLRRARLGVESREDAELSVVPQRLRRPGSVVLEIDDEDPVFDHLDPPRDAISGARGVRREGGTGQVRSPRDERHGPARRVV